MMQVLQYIVETVACSGLFLVVYRWLIAKRLSFGLCRRYLLATMLLSLLIPALELPVYAPVEQTEGSMLSYMLGDDAGELLAPGTAEVQEEIASDAPLAAVKQALDMETIKKTLTWTFVGLYALIVALSLALILHSAHRIWHLRRRSVLTFCDEYTIAEHEQTKTPFSFLKTIFLGYNYEYHEREQIIAHEASHIRHRHSYERVALSVLRSFFWFNPFLWMAEKELEEVQEWEADKDVLSRGYELKTYRTTIFKQLFGYNPDISCGLNHSLTKQRFIMMTQSHRGKGAWSGLAATLALTAGMVLAFGATARQADAPSVLASPISIYPPCEASVRNSFGEGGKTSHSGIDYVLNEGDPVYAAARGEISSITRDSGNGLMLVLKHENGMETRYAHLSKIQILSRVQISGVKRRSVLNFITESDHSNETISGKVDAGQLIGYAGASGRATGPHLHFELRKDGKAVDPAPLFVSDKPAIAPLSIYVIEGTSKPGEEYFAVCNGKLCKINEEIRAAVSSYFAGRDMYFATVKLEVDKDVPVEVFNKVKDELRKAQALKVNSRVADENLGGMIVLSESATIDLVSGPEGRRIYVDGVPHSLDQVASTIGRMRDAAEDPFEFVVNIKADKDIPMGVITDIKAELRKCKALRINYQHDGSSIFRILPPSPRNAGPVGVEDAVGSISRRNVVVVRLNHRGQMFMGDRYVKGDIHDGEYYRKEIDRLKDIIANPDDDIKGPEKVTRDIRMPDGSLREFKVSKAIISFMADRATSYADYNRVMGLITTAYRELREELSAELFSKTLSELSDAELQTIYEAVPMSVSEPEYRDVARK